MTNRIDYLDATQLTIDYIRTPMEEIHASVRHIGPQSRDVFSVTLRLEPLVR